MNDSLETIAQIKTLKDLKMADNVLTGELSSAIAELPDLEILELQGNKLSSLPDEVSALSHLRILNVSNNQLSSLPMAELSKTTLVQLLASKNHLSGTLFPDSVSSMARLQILDVSINSISSLTTGSLSFPSLQSLDIAFNRVTMLPEVSSWTSLISILAKDNKIAAIPEGFTSLTSLRSADFTGNDFPRLDPHIALMSGLEKFLIAANPIRERKFLTMSTEELKKDLKARLGLDEAGGGVD
jgi:Leucine-rich repeat (LRR) protein